ncbi:MAG: FecCD family ABC transporter permease [Actinomycetota bacterium]
MEAATPNEGGILRPAEVGSLGVPWRWALASVAVLLVALAIGVAVGPAHLSLGGIVGSVFARFPFVHRSSDLTAQQESILWSLRVPRVVLGALAGGTLAIAGAAYQGTFRNPLADPYLLGAAAGAELGATLAITFLPGRAVLGVNLVAVAAFAGASLAVAGAYVLGRSAGGMRSVTSLILAGVAIASFLTAVQTYVQQRNADQIRQVYAWLLGRLQTAGWQGVSLVAPYVAICVVVVVAHRRVLDVLQFGDDEAASLGVRPRRVRLWVVVAATLGTAAVVAVGGAIAFVGIIVPHTVRLMVGRSYRVVVPLSLALGAAFLVLADTLARVVVAPAELPIGVITALIGAPFFVVVLRSTRAAAP